MAATPPVRPPPPRHCPACCSPPACPACPACAMIHSVSRKSGLPPERDAPTSRNRSRSPSARGAGAIPGGPVIRATPGTVTVGPAPDRTQAEREGDAEGDSEGDATLRTEHGNADRQADQNANRPGPDSGPDTLRTGFRHVSILFGPPRPTTSRRHRRPPARTAPAPVPTERPALRSSPAIPPSAKHAYAALAMSGSAPGSPAARSCSSNMTNVRCRITADRMTAGHWR